jgi:hypothetical protein
MRIGPTPLRVTDLSVIQELTARRAERVRDRDIHVLMPAVAVGIARNGNVPARNVKSDANVERIAVPRVTMRLVDHDGAMLDPADIALKALDPTMNRSLDGRARSHSAERDFKRCLHDRS